MEPAENCTRAPLATPVGTQAAQAGPLNPMVKPRRGDLPISDYALVGDGATSALIGMDGSVDWLCFGRFDGPAVFCRLLDTDRGGYLYVAPEGGYRSTRRYVGRTNVLETEFECARGKIRLTDCMPLDTGTAPMLLRKLEGLGGHVPVRVEFFPTFDFARALTRIALEEGGCLAQAGSSSLRLSCPVPMTVEANRATALIHVREGQTHWITLGHGQVLFDDEGAERALRCTLEAWERWAAQGTYRGPYADILLRSALVLKLLTYRATGAIVAAPTTSLPESPGGVRNWDYRFTWLRDASWVVSALMDLGYHDESMAFVDYLEGLDLEHRKASVLYDVHGHEPNPEQILGHLCGYGGARPVRIGNGAAHQRLGKIAR